MFECEDQEEKANKYHFKILLPWYFINRFREILDILAWLCIGWRVLWQWLWKYAIFTNSISLGHGWGFLLSFLDDGFSLGFLGRKRERWLSSLMRAGQVTWFYIYCNLDRERDNMHGDYVALCEWFVGWLLWKLYSYGLYSIAVCLSYFCIIILPFILQQISGTEQ